MVVAKFTTTTTYTEIQNAKQTAAIIIEIINDATIQNILYSTGRRILHVFLGIHLCVSLQSGQAVSPQRLHFDILYRGYNFPQQSHNIKSFLSSIISNHVNQRIINNQRIRFFAFAGIQFSMEIIINRLIIFILNL